MPAPYPYRCECHGAAPLCPRCSGDALEAALLAAGPDTVAAFIAEPVGGSSTGASVPPTGYWRRVRELCDRYEVLWVADEVLTGAGRTGTWSALEPYGVVPDIMTLGKGIAGGYVPLSAVVAPRRLVDVLAARARAPACTRRPSPIIPCSAPPASRRCATCGEHRLIERCAEMGRRPARQAGGAARPSAGGRRSRPRAPGRRGVRGGPGQPGALPRSARFAETFTAAALEAGLVVWPNVGHADGVNGDLVMLAPPFVITEDRDRRAGERFGRALTRGAERLGAAR